MSGHIWRRRKWKPMRGNHQRYIRDNVPPLPKDWEVFSQRTTKGEASQLLRQLRKPRSWSTGRHVRIRKWRGTYYIIQRVS
jgi:hypothetical protein